MSLMASMFEKIITIKKSMLQKDIQLQGAISV